MISAGGAGDPVAIEGGTTGPRTGSDLENDLARGYIWDGGDGAAGPADNAAVHAKNLISAWDRISRGWANFRYLTPEQRGCYALRPFLDGCETLILFDPNRPAEYYIAELRTRIAERNEVPASGFYVTWNNTNEAYWRSVLNRDRDFWTWATQTPAAISAAVPGVAANPMLRPISLNQSQPLGLGMPTVAFRDPMRVVALPLGDGSPSRFTVSFSCSDGENTGAVCIH